MAIDEFYDEHEQGERVRDWLRRNALGLVGGVALGVALIGGWQYWQKHQHAQRVEAGNSYQLVQNSIAAGDLEQARAQADALESDSYGMLAALDLAKAQVEAGDTDAAIETLRGQDDSDPALDPIRRHRLALLLVEVGEPAQAVELLAGAEDPASLESLGDAHVALGQQEQARQSYQSALQQLDVMAPQRNLVELKLIDAGGEPAQSGTI